jgi:hypothetical protein
MQKNFHELMNCVHVCSTTPIKPIIHHTSSLLSQYKNKCMEFLGVITHQAH